MIWRTKDGNGNNYIKVGGTDETKAILCIGGKNKLYTGKVNISLRKDGVSKFGEEVVFQFKIDGLEKEYMSSSPWNHIEFYLPFEVGKKYIEQMSVVCDNAKKNQKIEQKMDVKQSRLGQ